MSTLRVYESVEQRSDEWYDQRRGMVTASAVGQLLTSDSPDAATVPCPACNVERGPCLSLASKKPTLLKTAHSPRVAAAAALPPVLKVADNDTSRGLTRLLATERITGHTDPTYVNADMWRGIEHEPIARDKYAEHNGVEVEQVGFMVRRFDDGSELGYSPDGLIGDDGLLEIKCPRAKTHVGTILADKVPAQYMAQLQAGLLVSGREWIDYVSFCGGLPMWTKRVTPDPAWQTAIVEAVAAFEKAVESMVSDYYGAVAGLPETERIEMEMVI